MLISEIHMFTNFNQQNILISKLLELQELNVIIIICSV